MSEDRPGEYLVDAPATPKMVASITAWLAERHVVLADLRAGRETLEDVFLRLTSSPVEDAAVSPVRRSSHHRAGGLGRRRR